LATALCLWFISSSSYAGLLSVGWQFPQHDCLEMTLTTWLLQSRFAMRKTIFEEMISIRNRRVIRSYGLARKLHTAHGSSCLNSSGTARGNHPSAAFETFLREALIKSARVPSAAKEAAEKCALCAFRWERRALALRKCQQIQGALAPGLSAHAAGWAFSAACKAALNPSGLRHPSTSLKTGSEAVPLTKQGWIQGPSATSQD